METTTETPIESISALEQAIADIGELEAQITAVQSAMDDAARDVIRPFIERMNPMKTRLSQVTTEARLYCLATQGDLLKGRKGKTVRLSTGTVQFKRAKARVAYDHEEVAIQALKDAGFDGAIRTREELNKPFILDHASICEVVQDVRIEGGEETVVIKPTTIS